MKPTFEEYAADSFTNPAPTFEEYVTTIDKPTDVQPFEDYVSGIDTVKLEKQTKLMEKAKELKDHPILSRVKMAAKMTPLWQGLKVLGWIGSRMEMPIATVATDIAKARVLPMQLASAAVETLITGQPSERGPDITKLVNVPKHLVDSLKTWIPGHPVPNDVVDSITFFKTYYDTIAGPGSGETPEKSPEWATLVPGLAASMFVPLPGISTVAKGTRGAGKIAGKLLGIPEKVPLWETMKLENNAEKLVRMRRVQELAESVSQKNLTALAEDLSKTLTNPKTGNPITVSERTLSLRLSQLVGGKGQAGVTTIPELEKLAAPIAKELRTNGKLLLDYGILEEPLYTTKLDKAAKAALQLSKTRLQEKINKLSDPPYQAMLLKMAGKLQVTPGMQEKIANNLLTLGETIEDGGPKLSGKLSELLDIDLFLKREAPVGEIALIKGKTVIIPGKAQYKEQSEKIFKLLQNIEKADAKDRIKEINTLLKEASRVEGLDVVGKIPIIKKILNMKRNFPGKAARIKEYMGKIEDINEDLWTSEVYGGAPYFPRLYNPKEVASVEKLVELGYRPHNASLIRAQYAKERMFLKPEIRKAMGEIEEIGYPAIKRLVQETADLHNAEAFNKVAEMPGWTGDVPMPQWYKKAIPDEKSYGALAGKYVLPAVYRDVMSMTQVKTNAGQVYDTLLGIWKSGKVSLSPPVLMHNLGGNGILLEASGVDITKHPGLALQVLKERHGNTEEWKTMHKYLLGGTQVNAEIFDEFLNSYSKGDKGAFKVLTPLTNLTKLLTKYPTKFWQYSEYMYKGMKYLDSRQTGMSVIEAVKEAQKWLINYQDLSLFEKQVARRIIPFYTFQSRAIPLVLESLEKRPLVLAKYALLPYLITKFSLNRLKMEENDWSSIEKELPDYIKSGHYVLMPYRDKNGDLRIWDWEAFLPWNALADATSKTPLSPLLANPFFQIAADNSRNINSLTGQPIWKKTDNKEEKATKILAYNWNILAPRLASTGFWTRMYNAIMGTPSKYGKIQPLPEAIAQEILGIRLVPIDQELNRRMNLFNKVDMMKELAGKLKDLSIRYTNKNISEEEFQTKRNQYQQQLSELQNE